MHWFVIVGLHSLSVSCHGNGCTTTRRLGTVTPSGCVSAPPSIDTIASVAAVFAIATAKSKLFTVAFAVTVGKYSQPM